MREVAGDMETQLQKTGSSGWTRKTGWFVLGLALMLGLISVGEWYFRFARYHWEMQIVNLPPETLETLPTAGSDVAFVTNHQPARAGGDLTALIGLQRIAAPFKETRPAGFTVVDAHGFVNAPYDLGAKPDVVVVGDSFMTVGLLADTFSSRLAAKSGLQVLNRAMFGHGPFVSVESYLDDPRYITNHPDFLVWGFAEREISPKSFQRLHDSMKWRQEITHAGEVELDRLQASRNVYVHWRNLAPAALRDSLPASSLFAQTSQWVWNRLRSLVFGQLHPDLIQARRDVPDGPMLFYRYQLEALRREFSAESIARIAAAVKELDTLCNRRGMQLIVLLIPEKEQVYRNWIPERHVSPAQPLPPSALVPLEAALLQEGVQVVNMLPVFHSAMADGARVYWRDDTHWNPRGIDLAADAVGSVIAGKQSSGMQAKE